MKYAQALQILRDSAAVEKIAIAGGGSGETEDFILIGRAVGSGEIVLYDASCGRWIGGPDDSARPIEH